jgi:hypothetical protein
MKQVRRAAGDALEKRSCPGSGAGTGSRRMERPFMDYQLRFLPERAMIAKALWYVKLKSHLNQIILK